MNSRIILALRWSSPQASSLNAMIPLLCVFWAVMFYKVFKFLLNMTLLGIIPNFWLIIEDFFFIVSQYYCRFISF